MLRLFAALILADALAPSARADTSVIISGGGFSFFSGSEGLHRFHHERRHWRRFHDGGGFVFHRLPRRHDLFLSSPHHQHWTTRRKHRTWEHGHDHHHRKHAKPQVVIILPWAFDGRIKILPAPGHDHVGSLRDHRTGHLALVPLPSRKPGWIVLAD